MGEKKRTCNHSKSCRSLQRGDSIVRSNLDILTMILVVWLTCCRGLQNLIELGQSELDILTLKKVVWMTIMAVWLPSLLKAPKSW